MANIKTTFDPKSLVIANILTAGETIVHDWSIDEMYQIVVTKGLVSINGITMSVPIAGATYSAISVNDVPPNTTLSVEAITDASFLILLRSDNESVVNQLLPGDGNVSSYYEYMRDFLPSWHSQGFPPNPPDTITDDIDDTTYPGWHISGTLTISTDRLKTLILEGWV